MPENVCALVKKTAQRLYQITDKHGMCRYIVGEASNGSILMLPTLPQLFDQIEANNQFPDPKDLFLNTQGALQIIEKYSMKPLYKILDEEGLVCGIVANGFLFPVKPTAKHDDVESLQVYPSRVNPLKVNQALLKAAAADPRGVFLSLYVDYLYELLLMQNPTREQDVEFMPLDRLVAFL